MVKNLPIRQEAWILTLGREDLLEKKGSPLQCSCLEKPMDRGAWRATVPRVTKSWAQMRDQRFYFGLNCSTTRGIFPDQESS